MFVYIIGLFLVAYVHSAPTETTAARWCVTSNAEEAKCKALKQNLHERDIAPGIECIRALDKYDCMSKIEHKEADVGCYWTMDTYIAGKYHHLKPFLSEKHNEDDGWTYAYYALAVIHKDDDTIHSLEDLKGKKSCHTGVNRHVGWLFPSYQFVAHGLFDNGSCVSNVANMANLFSKSCVSNVNNDAHDPTGEYREKLCSLCGSEGDKFCSKEDKYASYTGALNCLVDKRGDVAFVKDTTFAELVKLRPELADKKGDYRLLCLDGSRKTLDEYKECNWGKIPERACLTSASTSASKIEAMSTMLLDAQKDLTSFQLFQSTSYGEKHLMFGDYTKKLSLVGDRDDYRKFLEGYVDVREKQFPCDAPVGKWCTISNQEQAKCERMRDAFEARFIRPPVECVQGSDTADCLKKIKEHSADLMSLDGGDIYKGGKQHSLQVIASELRAPGKEQYYAVAVVKKSNQDITFNNLNGKKSCHTGIGRTAGWNIPVGILLSTNQIKMPDDCNIAEAVGAFFTKSCAPGSLLPSYNPTGRNPASLCELCSGNGDAKCSRTEDEPFYGYTGAFRCMATGEGDVAFVKHTTALENTDGINTDDWAKTLKSEDYELLCKDGSRQPITNYQNCNLAKVAAHGIVTAGDKEQTEIADYQRVLQLGTLYYGNSTAFHMFQSGPGAKDLLFSDSTVDIKPVASGKRLYREYLGAIADVFDHIGTDSCQASK